MVIALLVIAALVVGVVGAYAAYALLFVPLLGRVDQLEDDPREERERHARQTVRVTNDVAKVERRIDALETQLVGVLGITIEGGNS